MNQPQLTPRDDAHIPSKERMTPEQKKLADEIAKLSKSENHAISVLVQTQMKTLEATEENARLLQVLMDLLVKAMVQFGVPLPAGVEADIKSGDYDPDELPEPEKNPGDGDGDEEPEPA